MPIVRELETRQVVIENGDLSMLFREVADWIDANPKNYLWEVFIETEPDNDGVYYAKITLPK